LRRAQGDFGAARRDLLPKLLITRSGTAQSSRPDFCCPETQQHGRPACTPLTPYCTQNGKDRRTPERRSRRCHTCHSATDDHAFFSGIPRIALSIRASAPPPPPDKQSAGSLYPPCRRTLSPARAVDRHHRGDAPAYARPPGLLPARFAETRARTRTGSSRTVRHAREQSNRHHQRPGAASPWRPHWPGPSDTHRAAVAHPSLLPTLSLTARLRTQTVLTCALDGPCPSCARRTKTRSAGRTTRPKVGKTRGLAPVLDGAQPTTKPRHVRTPADSHHASLVQQHELENRTRNRAATPGPATPRRVGRASVRPSQRARRLIDARRPPISVRAPDRVRFPPSGQRPWARLPSAAVLRRKLGRTQGAKAKESDLRRNPG